MSPDRPANDFQTTVRLNLGPDDPVIDPARYASHASLQVINQLFKGLVSVDDESAITKPALATSWSISTDRTVYTFTLRTDAVWSDGTPLTAHDVRYGILRNLDPAVNADMAYILSDIINAEEYNEGIIIDPTLVGITVLNDTQLRFDLNRSTTTFPAVLAMVVARPLPAWAIAAHPGDWTEPGNIVTNGAYSLEAWSHGTSMTLFKNDTYYDDDAVQIDQVHFSMVDEATAWGMYQAGQLDSVLVPQNQWAATTSDPLLQLELMSAPRHCTYYYGFNTALPPFDNLLVRKAFASAINRPALIDQAVGYAQQPALTFTARGVFGHVDGYAEGVGFPYNPALAQQWLSDAGYPGGAGLPPITLWLNTSPGHQAIAEYVQQCWLDNLGVSVTLADLPWNEYLDFINSGAAQVWRLGWCVDYPDAYNYLDGAIESAGGRFGGWSNATYDTYVQLAGENEVDPVVRWDSYRQAEEILVEQDAVMIPLYHYANGLATKPALQRTFVDGGYGGQIADWRVDVTQEILLDPGWNMVSSFAVPPDCDLDVLFSDIGAELVLVKNGRGEVYWPDQGINTIGCWNPLDGYQIYMSSAAVLAVHGQQAEYPGWFLDLDSGWSLIPYYPDMVITAEPALASISGELALAKNGAGQVFWPAYAVNQLGDMEPGSAYQVYLENPGTLIYPPGP